MSEAYHIIKFNLDIQNKTASLKLDDHEYPNNLFSKTTKTGWGTKIAARLQVEIISIYPPLSGFTASHKAYF